VEALIALLPMILTLEAVVVVNLTVVHQETGLSKVAQVVTALTTLLTLQ
jgi:hypothetical protein